MHHATDQLGVFYERRWMMKGYILSVIAAAIICAVAKSLLPNRTGTGRVVGLICGILMAITVLSPLVQVSFDHIGDYFDDISLQSAGYIAEGESAARETLSAVIKEQAETYILDKATRMGLDISVEVELDADNHSVPCGVTVTGTVSPYAREVIGSYMEDTLGIAKENQKWI